MHEHELSIDTEGHRLSGTVCLPAPTGRYPVVLMLHGSGPLDRDENIRGQRLDVFNTIAHRLAASGIASVRYDKRGCGKSTGVYAHASHSDFIHDALAWVDRLASAPFSAGGITLLGHSEGTVVAPRVAVERAEMRALVLLCPTVTDFETVLMRQAEQIEGELTRLPGLQGKLLRLYTRLTGSPIASQRKLIARIRASTTTTLRIGLRTFEAAWLRELLQLEISPLLAAVRCPMLVVAAAKDIQCDPEDAQRIAAQNPLAEAHVIEDLTHILRRDTRPASLFGYQQLLAQPVDSQLLELIAGWLERQRDGAQALDPRDELS
jgi:pimeloyl-ACP methyl ester carboxylesterase